MFGFTGFLHSIKNRTDPFLYRKSIVLSLSVPITFTCNLYGAWNLSICFPIITISRKEHKSHSPSCHFIALKKKIEELSVEEFFKLQKERQKFMIVCVSGGQIIDSRDA